MAEGLHEEGIIPAGTLDFEADGLAVGVGSQDVKGQPAQNGEVRWSIVLARAVGLLGKMDVEHPMKPVLDTPMTAGDGQQPLWGDIFGQEVVAHDRSIGALAPEASSRGDPAHRSDAWKAVEGSQAGIAHDGRPPRLAPIVGAVGLFGDAARARSCKLLRNRSEQPPTVCLDRQNIVAAALAHGRRKSAGAMQRVGGNDAAFEAQKVQHFQCPRRLVPARRFLLGQSHPGFDRKDVDQLQRCGLAAALVGPAQGLAVDGHHPGEFETIGLGKGRHETAKGEFKGLRLEQTEHPAERVVARNAMLQAKQEPQQPFLRPSKLFHLRATPGPAYNRSQRDEQHFQQIVPCIVRTRVDQPPKGLLELPHPTPSMIREPTSESVLPSNAIASENPYAIPLPWRGGVARARAAWHRPVRAGWGDSLSPRTAPKLRDRHPTPPRIPRSLSSGGAWRRPVGFMQGRVSKAYTDAVVTPPSTTMVWPVMKLDASE